jgi:argininosuccinate synthase
MATRYAELVYNGQWFSPLREAYDAFATTLADTVTGTVTMKLFKGNATVIGRTSPYSLYQQDLASFNMTGYDAKDAAGFIRLFGLQLRGRKRLSPIAVEELAR